jgi:hypothetical protein
MVDWRERLFDRIFDVLEISKLKGEDLKMYRKSMRNIDERQLAIDCAVEEASAQLLKRGRVEGMMKAAKSMLADGLAPARVARITKLPKEQILAMR